MNPKNENTVVRLSRASQPGGACLSCAHIRAFAVWDAALMVGICGPCRDAAEHLRGPCSIACQCGEDARSEP